MEIREQSRNAFNGWAAVGWVIFLVAAAIAGAVWSALAGIEHHHFLFVFSVVVGVLTLIIGLPGFFMLQPNEAAVLTLFGQYKGTVRTTGLLWANPFFAKHKVSLRVRNFVGQTLKVNDQRGNPIEIAVIVVWHVEDTAEAMFQVQDYSHYVTVQSEAALRHTAMGYPYDTFEGDTLSLRGSTDEISHALQVEIQQRVAPAGVRIDEARLSHLAYAPEIAEAMLRRQQADAIVAARKRIVEGAVGMVESALESLEQHKTVQLDDERKMAIISNLLVVICSHEAVRPVVNTGTLYT